MIIETAQLLSIAAIYGGPDLPTRKIPWSNHPCSIWTRASIENYTWLHSLGLCLGYEFLNRYEHTHACTNKIRNLDPALINLPKIGMTPFAQAMPDQYRNIKDAVSAYRSYYLNEKAYFAKWKTGNVPPWWNITPQ